MGLYLCEQEDCRLFSKNLKLGDTDNGKSKLIEDITVLGGRRSTAHGRWQNPLEAKTRTATKWNCAEWQPCSENARRGQVQTQGWCPDEGRWIDAELTLLGPGVTAVLKW